LTEDNFVKTITENNGEIYIVGGWVRDMIRNKPAKDKDYVVCKLTENLFCQLFPQAQKVGKSFPVFLLNINNKKCEIAFARTEEKKGLGYKGFTTIYTPSITIENDLWRRDTRMNSIALKLPERLIIDPFNGTDDINAKRIQATSIHFSEDPVRALRAARQAAELDFFVEESTLKLMYKCAEELQAEPGERIVNELKRALAAKKPTNFFIYLHKANLLQIIFPEIFALIGKTQPAFYHPEGDSFNHTMLALKQISQLTDNINTRFAALAHDLGKGLTPAAMLPHHYEHEETGLTALANWNKRTTLPKLWLNSAQFVIKEHMRAARLQKPAKIADMLAAIEKNPLGIDEFCKIIKVDNKELPNYLQDIHFILKLFHNINMSDCPAQLQGKQIADWLKNERTKLVNEYLHSKTLQ